jgi:hypothetical protein
LPDDARQVAGDVDHGVPVAVAQGIEVAVAIAVKLLDLGEELRVRLPAREGRDLVPARERAVDGRAAEELGSAQN